MKPPTHPSISGCLLDTAGGDAGKIDLVHLGSSIHPF